MKMKKVSFKHLEVVIDTLLTLILPAGVFWDSSSIALCPIPT